jgi:hypothetical protein
LGKRFFIPEERGIGIVQAAVNWFKGLLEWAVIKQIEIITADMQSLIAFVIFFDTMILILLAFAWFGKEKERGLVKIAAVGGFIVALAVLAIVKV